MHAYPDVTAVVRCLASLRAPSRVSLRWRFRDLLIAVSSCLTENKQDVSPVREAALLISYTLLLVCFTEEKAMTAWEERRPDTGLCTTIGVFVALR